MARIEASPASTDDFAGLRNGWEYDGDGRSYISNMGALYVDSNPSSGYLNTTWSREDMRLPDEHDLFAPVGLVDETTYYYKIQVNGGVNGITYAPDTYLMANAYIQTSASNAIVPDTGNGSYTTNQYFLGNVFEYRTGLGSVTGSFTYNASPYGYQLAIVVGTVADSNIGAFRYTFKLSTTPFPADSGTGSGSSSSGGNMPLDAAIL